MTDPQDSEHSANSAEIAETGRPSWREALGVWVRVAALSFGGPAGQIAVMQRILVDEKRWLSPRRFLHALNYCMLLPGPEAQQLATYTGWLKHGTAGGLLAGGLFIVPGFVSILALSILYVGYRQAAWVEGLFFGLKAVVVAIVLAALIRIGRRALDRPAKRWIATLAFVALFFFGIPFPAVIAAAAGCGWWLGRSRRKGSLGAGISDEDEIDQDSTGAEDSEEDGTDDASTFETPSWSRTLGVALVWLTIWWLPAVALIWWLGPDHVFAREATFFGKATLVTFGGAYAVLAYVAQRAVEDFGWLAPGEMLDGLGMAETTPGPLIQVVQFVGFLGAYRNPGDLAPLAAGIVGALITTWMTFAPSFLWIFAGAPYVERLRRHEGLSNALGGVTAAVVGVIANLALWFALHTVFGSVETVSRGWLRLSAPVWSTLDPWALAIAVGAAFCLFRLRWGMGRTLVAGVAAGLIARLVFHLVF